MRFILAVLLAALVAVSHGANSTDCYTLTKEDVPFCDIMVGQSIDMNYHTDSWNGKSYVSFVDEQIRQVYNSVVQQIDDLSKKNNYEVCTDCETQFKWLLCAGAFPRCGYSGCITPIIAEAFLSICPTFCMCEGCSPLLALSGDCTKENSQPNPQYDANTPCDYTSIGNYILRDLGKCSKNEISISHCKTFVDVCSCNNANYESLCSNAFSQDGYTLPNWPSTGSCSKKNGWCAWTSSLASRDHEYNDNGGNDFFCPNPHLCIAVPAPLIHKVAILGLDLNALEMKVEDFISSLPPIPPSSSSASSLVTAPLLLVLSLFLAVLVL